MDDMRLQVLNANIDVTNVIEGDNFNDILLSTFKKIKEILSDHVGPFGKFAVLTDPTDMSNIAIHTKDGINIIRKMSYASPMQDYIRKTLMYIGERAERTAGDATTASMIISAAVVEYLFNDGIMEEYPYTFFVEQYNEFVKLVSELNDKIKIDLNKLIDTINKFEKNTPDYMGYDALKEKIIQYVAYSQAYTSSHGKKELSQIVADMFSKTPKEVWNYLRCERERVETDVNLKLEWDKSQYSLTAILPDQTKLNAKSNTAYINDDVDLVVVTVDPSYESSMIHQDLFKLLEEKRSSEKDVVLLLPSNASNTFLIKLEEESRKNKHLIVFTHYTGNTSIQDLDGICLVSGISSHEFQSKPIVFNNVKCHYGLDSCLKLYNLYEDNSDGFKRINHDTGPLGLFLKELEDNIKVIESETNGNNLTNRLVDLRKFYMKLLLAKRPVLKIGGNAHDNSLYEDIVKDTILAVNATLTHGFNFSQNYSLRMILDHIINDSSKYIFTKIAKAFIMAIDDYREALFKHRKLNDGMSKLCNRPYTIFDFHMSIHNNEKIQKFIDESENVHQLLYMFWTANYTAIIQPANVDVAMIKRFGELGLKFLKSARVIVPNGAILNKS